MENQNAFYPQDKEYNRDIPANEIFKEEFIKDLSSFVEGQIVEGVIVAVTVDSVFVDIGYKSEGEISKSEFEKDPAQGEKIRVMILRRESKDGKLVLSKQKADEIVKWNSMTKSYREGLPIEGKIIESIKGGFTVDVEGFRAFLPISQVSMRKVYNTQDYLGKVLLFKIDKIDDKKNVVLSHRRYLDELKEKKIEELFNTKGEGDIVEGVVKDIVSYGVFIDLGGIDGLLHINDISWGKVTDPKKYVSKGEKLYCKILLMDNLNRKISLGLKQLVPDPWLSFENRYKKGGKYKGTVTKLIKFGAFIELEEGIEGLLHISDLSWTKRIRHPKEILKVGDIVEIMILDFDIKKKTISLGLKQVLPNPWDTVDVHYPVGSRIKPKVTRVTKFGVFMELEEGVVGLLHSNDMSWTKPLKNSSSIFKKGKSTEVVVLAIDKENKKIQLGLKQLKKNPWENLKTRHPKGSVVTGTVTSITDFGVFVKIDEDIEGLIHLSQLSNEKVEAPNTLYKAGDVVKAIILDIDEEKKKVTLSAKEYLNHLEEKEITKYLESEDTKTASVTFGELVDLSKIGK